ncbi:MAG TPA: Cof-type HAD-IIB family hydrolase [Clostridia bacterium]|nr:Cof-type HAD-IIB family hydrolase [Clostridia bacterium]
MHLRNIKLIALDMDGTLLTDRKTVSPRSLRAIRTALERGVTVAPTSGRNLETLPRELLEIPEIRYVITCNGARIWDRHSGAAIYERLIPLPTVLELMDRLKGYECVVEASVADRLYISFRDAKRELLYVPPELRKYLKQLRWETEDVRDLLIEKGLDVDKMLVYTPDEEEQERVRRILAGRRDLAVSFSVKNNLEINADGSSKGDGLCELARRLGIEKSEIMACGDSGNDLSMLETAGFSVAMGNAVPEAKKRADVVTLTNNEDGVAAAIEQYVLFGETV